MKTKTAPTTFDLSLRLTEHFTLGELLRSDKADEMGYSEQYTPPEAVINNLRLTCQLIVQPLRTYVGKPIIITSGYRAPRTNAAAGGSFNSQHMKGQAVDFKIIGVSIADTIDMIRDLDLPFDQLIDEFGQWVHVSYSPRHRAQVLLARKNKFGRTIYKNYGE